MSIAGVLIMTILFLLLLAVVLARAAASFWLGHRLRLTLLELIGRHPELFQRPEAPDEILARARDVASPHNHVLTGLFLALFGAAGVAGGHFLGISRLASGAHVGGLLCLLLALCWAVGGHIFQSGGGRRA